MLCAFSGKKTFVFSCLHAKTRNFFAIALLCATALQHYVETQREATERPRISAISMLKHLQRPCFFCCHFDWKSNYAVITPRCLFTGTPCTTLRKTLGLYIHNQKVLQMHIQVLKVVVHGGTVTHTHTHYCSIFNLRFMTSDFLFSPRFSFFLLA